MVNKDINKDLKTGKRLPQNQIKVQQLKNKQYIVTLPKMWAEILGLKKGDPITFVPGTRGGIELIKKKEEQDG